MGADEHVHQRAFANAQAKSITEHATQTLVGKRLKALVINRQRMNARPERRRRGDAFRAAHSCAGDLLQGLSSAFLRAVSYTHLRAHETRHDLVCRLLLEKKKKK